MRTVRRRDTRQGSSFVIDHIQGTGVAVQLWAAVYRPRARLRDMDRPRLAVLLLAAVGGFAACGRPDSRSSAAPTTPEPPPPAQITAEPDIAERPFAFTAADLDA